MRSNIVRTASGASLPVSTLTRRVLLRALGGLEEVRELVQVVRAERREDRHRRPLVDAARAPEVRDLEGDPLLLGALGAEIRGPEVRGADAEIGVAGSTARDGEHVRPC